VAVSSDRAIERLSLSTMVFRCPEAFVKRTVHSAAGYSEALALTMSIPAVVLKNMVLQ
jgi:hypothetical protein